MLRPYHDIAGTWPVLRRDERLSGHQELAGDVVRPVVAWRYYLGGPLFDARLIADGRRFDVLVPFGGCLHRYDAAGALRWKSSALGIEAIIGVDDVDADGSIEIVASNGKSVFVLSADDGVVLWREYLGPPFAGGFMHTTARLCRFDGTGRALQLAIGLLSSKEVVVYDFSTGARAPERRHILWMDDFFHPSVIAADLDGDGRDELVVTKLSSVYVFDAQSGTMTGECRWSSGGTAKRNYGMLEAVDLDGSGALDLVIISDRVSRHLAVVRNDGRGGLSNSWDRFIEHIYDADECELRFVTSSIVDIDSDGALEILVSIYNEHGDGRWWLEVIDAVTGRTKHRVEDAYLRGIARPDAETAPIVLVSRDTSRVPAARAPVSVLFWSDGAFIEQWSHESAAFVGRFADDEPRRALFRTDLPPADDALVAWLDGEPYVTVLVEGGLGLLPVREASPALRIVRGTKSVCAVLCVGDLDDDGRDELVVSDPHGLVTMMQPDGTVIGVFAAGMRLRPGTGAYYMARPMSTPVVAADQTGRYCAVPDGGAEAHVVAWNAARMQPTSAARFPLRGRIGPEEAYHAYSWCDVDGRLALLGSTVGEAGAAIVAISTDGEELRRWYVEGLPASPATPAARVGLHDWAIVAGVTDATILVAGFRSPSMNSERMLALDASGGEPLWRLEAIRVPGHVLAGAPWSAMSIERGEDGVRAHFLAKDTLVAIDAASGAHASTPLNLRAFNAADMVRRRLTMDDFSAYGSIIPVDVDGDDRTERILIGNYGGHGAIDADGAARWWHSAPLSSLTTGFGGLADIDGDGRLELGVSDATGEFICLDAATGIERWRLPLGEVASGVVTCDIDRDGRAEYIVATREGSVIAIGAASNGSGVVKWRLDLGYTLGPPIVSDFDGDGSSEVLVVSGDGALYSIVDRRRAIASDTVS